MGLPKKRQDSMKRKNKKQLLFEQMESSFAILTDECDVESPLTTAYKMIHDPDTPYREKVSLLQFLAPYVHSKQATTMDVNHTLNINTVAVDKLNNFLLDDSDTKPSDDVIDGEIIE